MTTEEKTELKNVIDEIAEIADSCSEAYRVECFKILLQHRLQPIGKQSAEGSASASSIPEPQEEKNQREISQKDLNIKFKNFLKNNEISMDIINQVFYFEDGAFLPIFEDYKTTKVSEMQIRIALIQAMINAMSNGSFEFDIESVRAECQKRKAYDKGNFSANFKNNSVYFDSYSSSKNGENIKISEAGKKKLANLIKDLSK